MFILFVSSLYFNVNYILECIYVHAMDGNFNMNKFKEIWIYYVSIVGLYLKSG